MIELSPIQVDCNKGPKNEILRDFVTQNEFRSFYKDAMGYATGPMTDEQWTIFANSCAGELFERIAYSVISESYPDRVILSPNETEAVSMIEANTTGDAIRFPVNIPECRTQVWKWDKEISALKVPDGILLDRYGKVECLLEYSLTRDPEYYRAKLARRVFKGYPIQFVTPSNGTIPRDVLSNRQVLPQICLPLTTNELRGFNAWVLCGYRLDEDTASLIELQNEVRYKYNRLSESAITDTSALFLSRSNKLLGFDAS